ncbi:MAG: hydantoinase/oxoprolinase family protein [Candidatus Thorarchaeota archaeon]|nr:MAG: hydantoinase/oxoprolinase family protein [Candidatus Thorarchaeota archaeon]
MKVIGVDVGGTFTDIIMIDSETGEQYVHKVPSTPESQDIAVTKGISELLSTINVTASDVGLIVHGTTVATNAMLERKGAKVCLLTTSGLEDVLEIGRQNRDNIYSLRPTRPSPLVDRDKRIGIKERMSATGETLQPLEEEEIERGVRRLREINPDSVAISFLFSFQNPEHEQRILRAVEDKIGCYAVASSNVLPEFREYERTSTTVLEAYLGPLVNGYLGRLDASLRETCPNANLTVMQSNGGTLLCSQAHGRAVGLAISGLAGGAVGGWEVANRAGIQNAITLDMGGTSCDISAISGRIVVRSDNDVGGLPIRTPSVDVKTIGAGGGSIAWLDEVGILHVGPQSAGADPGPASYNKGGDDATVTDANLLIGRLNPEYFLGGRVKLDVGKATRAMSRLAETLDTSTEEAALGIVRISTWNMVQAIREVTVERGRDPRQFHLVPFGGAGPTQAADIAEALGINEILIPPYPGITSAYGLICADLRVDVMRSVLLPHKQEYEEVIQETMAELSLDATKQLEAQGVERDNIVFEWKIDMRYAGQSHELEVQLPVKSKRIADISVESFEHAHMQAYGYVLTGRAVEWVTARVTASASQSKVTNTEPAYNKDEQHRTEREVLVEGGRSVVANVLRREKLLVDQHVIGPAIIEQMDTTTYIAPNWSAIQRSDGSILVRRKDSD